MATPAGSFDRDREAGAAGARRTVSWLPGGLALASCACDRWRTSYLRKAVAIACATATIGQVAISTMIAMAKNSGKLSDLSRYA